MGKECGQICLHNASEQDDIAAIMVEGNGLHDLQRGGQPAIVNVQGFFENDRFYPIEMSF